MPGGFVLIILAIEFLDEFAYGAVEAAWPLIRDDLSLGYVQIGLLLTVPAVIANIIEPVFFILGDVWRRRVLVLGGGLAFSAAFAAAALSPGFLPLLIAFSVSGPASGAFVSLSQATLMDLQPRRREQNMARWEVAGSVGIVAGTGALAAAVALGGSWRAVFLASGAIALFLTVLVWRHRRPDGKTAIPDAVAPAFMAALATALGSLRRWTVVRWLVLLEFSDLMLDVLHGYLALYLVDAAGASPSQAAAGLGVWIGAGLLGDLILVPLLERVRGVSFLRVSAVMQVGLFSAFLLVPGLWPKVGLASLMGLLNAGWYAIPQAGLFESMPGRSGSAMALKNISGLAGGLFPLAIGAVAAAWGLDRALWLLLAGPLVLIVALPRREKRPEATAG